MPAYADNVIERNDLPGHPRMRLHRDRYYIFVSDPDTRQVSTGTADLAKAMAFWADWIADHQEGTLYGREVKFDALARAFIQWCADHNRDSWRNALSRYEYRIAPELGGRTCGELADGVWWDDFFNRTVDPDQYGSVKVTPSARHKHGSAKLASTSAKVMQDWILRVYAWGISSDGGRRITSRQMPESMRRLPKLRVKKARAWSDTQMDAILDGLRQHDWRLYGYAALGFFTYQRPWLFCKLTRGMVDMDSRVINFLAIKPEKRHENDRKNVVDMPMNPDLYDVLLDVLAHTDGQGDDALILGGVQSLDQQLKNWLEANGIEGSAYWLKHTGITSAVRAKGEEHRTLDQMSELSGVSVRMLNDHYKHTTVEDKRHLVEGMRRRKRPTPKLVVAQ